MHEEFFLFMTIEKEMGRTYSTVNSTLYQIPTTKSFASNPLPSAPYSNKLMELFNFTLPSLNLTPSILTHTLSSKRPNETTDSNASKVKKIINCTNATCSSSANIEINKITDGSVHYQLIDSNAENGKGDKRLDVHVAIEQSETTDESGSNRNALKDLMVCYRPGDGRIIDTVKLFGQNKANESDSCSAEVESSNPRENDINAPIQTSNDAGKESNQNGPSGSTLSSQEELDKSDYKHFHFEKSKPSTRY